MMRFTKPITIQAVDEATEKWIDVFKLHARVNKSNGSEYLSGGTVQNKVNRVFEVRYFKTLEKIAFDTGSYRLIYNGHVYNITDYDDFQEKHKTVKLLGVATK